MKKQSILLILIMLLLLPQLFFVSGDCMAKGLSVCLLSSPAPVEEVAETGKELITMMEVIF
ncbi:hypothetical protein [Flavihumibacter sp.]|uniref:hypothetical protein n=1 Tax=Flavihumibacter sp. TaxID=1913981 RepID=UPI002FC8F54B|nr:hypothetical protein [Flavihumibacter sediminis]